MKVEINKEGVLVITPETWNEDQALLEWYEDNAKLPCNTVILFERKRNLRPQPSISDRNV